MEFSKHPEILVTTKKKLPLTAVIRDLNIRPNLKMVLYIEILHLTKKEIRHLESKLM